MRVDLIILGASARAAAFSALRAGLAPYAIDLFADSDLCDECPAVKIEHYPADFAKALAEAPPAPWIYAGGLENYPRLVAQMAGIKQLCGNPAEVLREVRNPGVLAARLREAGFATPEVRLSPPTDHAEGKRWLHKPRRSSAGLGIRWHPAGSTQQGTSDWYYQQFIPGASCSAVFAAASGECELLGATDQQSGAPGLAEEPFLYAGSAGPRTPSAREEAQLQRLGGVLTKDFRMRGLFNVDYVYDGERVWVLEVNPRYSASMEVLEYSLGQNVLARHLAEFDFQLSASLDVFPPNPPHYAAKGIVYAIAECRVTARMKELRHEWNTSLLRPSLADIPREGDLIRRGQPVVTVLATGETLAAANLQLQGRKKEITSAVAAR